jgi:GNAT superfamily N-acetyltransferase
LRIDPIRSPRQFLDAQRDFYRNDPHYVPPITLVDAAAIDPRKNAFFTRAETGFWLARDGRRVVGRISAARNLVHDEFWGDHIGFFGHFEAVDQHVAAALLEHAATWLRARGATALRGPVDLSTNYRTGLLVEGDAGPPAMMMPHNPPEYAAWLEATGLRKAKDVVALWIDTSTIDADRLRRLSQKLAERTRMRTRPLRMAAFKAELIWHLYNQIWERNWGFVPMLRDEFLREAMGFKPICTPELIQFAEVGGKPIGFIVGLPDTNLAALACNGRMLPFGWWKFLRRLKTVNHLRVLTLGVLPEYRGRGTDGALINAVVVEGVSRGFRSAECGWVLEDNLAMLAPLERLGARVFRRYRVYERGL